MSVFINQQTVLGAVKLRAIPGLVKLEVKFISLFFPSINKVFDHFFWLLFSRELLQCLTSADLSNEAFPFSTHKVINVAGHDCRALRITFVGELGWELHIPNDSCVRVYEAVVEAGKKFGIVNGGYRALDSLSAEKGYKHWHQDLRHDDTPLEAGLGFTCKLKKDTPFLGREALEKQKTEGLSKRLVCFTIDE